MEKWLVDYDRGYFKGVLDTLHFLEFLDKNLIASPKEKLVVSMAALSQVLDQSKRPNLEYFKNFGGQVRFKYKYEKGKVKFVEIILEEV